jgi:uncharacterized protein with HEPN domain
MLEAARAIGRYPRDVSLEEYRGNEMLRDAVERRLTILGEAARNVSPGFRSAHPGIPWRGIVAQRNVLAHDYGRIDDERVWRTVVDDLPRLIGQLEPLIPPLPPV